MHPFSFSFSCLPHELWKHVFEFDPTFRLHFSNHVVPYLRAQKIYRVHSRRYASLSSTADKKDLYIVLEDTHAILTNSLSTPSYQSMIYFYKPQEKKEYIAFFDIQELIPHPPVKIKFFQEWVPWSKFCERDIVTEHDH